jgi:hypothetical protein
MRVYISGPITGIPDDNRLEFCLAERALKAQGHEVVNPLDVVSASGSWSDHMRADIKAMMDCDAIHMLPGWRDSIWIAH